MCYIIWSPKNGEKDIQIHSSSRRDLMIKLEEELKKRYNVPSNVPKAIIEDSYTLEELLENTKDLEDIFLFQKFDPNRSC